MPSDPPRLAAAYFDGLTSRRHRALLAAQPGVLHFQGPEGERSIPRADIAVSEPQGRAPRTLRFSGGGFCEVPQGPDLDRLLAVLGHSESLVVRAQRRWRWAAGSFAGLLLVLWIAYRWGLPWLAETVAPAVPVSVLQPISRATLAELDRRILEPSSLPWERQKRLTRAFAAMAAHDPKLAVYGKYLDLEFRDAPFKNAFALPGGQIVLTDKLAQSLSDDEVLAVLAHEQGHLSQRHGVRLLIQSSLVSVAVAVYIGDVSSAAATAATFLLAASYTRDMEREADAYAADVLVREGKTPQLLARALEKIDPRGARCQPEKPQKKQLFTSESDWYSSHPDTCERIQRLNAGIR